MEIHKGNFDGTGTASVRRDARFADSLVELAETEAIVRAIRLRGIEVEYAGAEEVPDDFSAELERDQSVLLDTKIP